MAERSIPSLALTLGDPAGIGPEIVLKALAIPEWRACCTAIGTRSLLVSAYQRLRDRGAFPLADPETLAIEDVPLGDALIAEIEVGAGNAASGAASFAYLQTAIARTLAGKFQGIVTAPIAKIHWQAAGHNYPGQTEVLAESVGVDKFGMMFVARSPHTGWTLRTLLATTHIPLRQVPDALTPELLSRKLELLVDCLHRDFGIVSPRIVVPGLNPHSGEGGKLGTEEQDWLLPWLAKEQRDRPNIELMGAIPPDTLWVNPARGWFEDASLGNLADGYLALYHDQGLIPVKLMAFDRAINVTIGLPFVRTSPDHGTAFDIAGKGIARADSLQAAIALAVELTRQRQEAVRR